MRRLLPLLLAAALAAVIISPVYADRNGRGGGKASGQSHPIATDHGGPKDKGDAVRGRSADAPGHNKVQVTTPSGKQIWVAPPAAEHAAAFNRLVDEICDDLEDDEGDGGTETSDMVALEEEDDGGDSDASDECKDTDDEDDGADDGADDGDEDGDDGDSETETDPEALLEQLEAIADLVDQVIQQILAGTSS